MKELFYKLNVRSKMEEARDIITQYKYKNVGKNTIYNILSNIGCSEVIVDRFKLCLNKEFAYDEKLDSLIASAKRATSQLIRGIKNLDLYNTSEGIQELMYVTDELKYLDSLQIEELEE